MIEIKNLLFNNAINLEHNNQSKTVKHLIKELRTKKYNKHTHYHILKLNAHIIENFNLINDTEDFFFKTDIRIRKTLNKLFFSNISEKYLVYTDDKQKGIISNNDLHNYHNMIVNSKGLEDKKNLISKIFFYISHEQMILQERSTDMYVYRTISLFENCDISKQKLKEKTLLTFETIIFLMRFISTLFLRNNQIHMTLNINYFKEITLDRADNISEEDIKNFFNFISISKDEFKKKYLSYRTDKNGNLLSYETLEHIDNYLPKPSFYYPFIREDTENITLISYTALLQFLYLERIPALLVDNDNSYRSEVFGDLLEKYIYNLFLNFQIIQNNDVLKVHYYEDQQYSPKKGVTRHYPDIIIEGKDYILFIESKNAPFNLINALHEFKKESFSNIIKAIEVSNTNINEFMKYNPLKIPHLNNKRIFKFLCFNTVSSIMLTSLLNADFIETEELILTDLASLEIFTHLDSKVNVINTIDSFVSGLNNAQDTNTFSDYCRNNFSIDNRIFLNKHEGILRQFIKS